MIVDTHTRIWHSTDQLGPQVSAVYQQRYADPIERLDASEQAHIEASDQVDVSFVLGMRNHRLGGHIPDELISQFVRSRPDRLIGFAGVDPMAPDWSAQLDRLSALKLSGVVISPSEQGFHPSHSEAMKLYGRCQEMGLPVVVDQGNPFVVDSILPYADTALLDEPAREFPNLKMLIAHAGRPHVETTLALIGKHRNLYADLSGMTHQPWALYDTMVRAHELDVTDHLLFGSNFPHAEPHLAIQAIFSIIRFSQGTAWPNIPRQKLQAIVERDALTCLGLKRQAGGSGGSVPAAERSAARSKSSEVES